MPLDTTIPLKVVAPQPADLTTGLVRLAQLDNAQQQRELNSYKILEAQQEQQESRAIKDVLTQFQDQDLSDTGVQTKMLGAVGTASPTGYYKLSKLFGEQNKTQAEAKRASLEYQHKNLQMLHELIEKDSPATHPFTAALIRQLYPAQAHLVSEEFEPDPDKRLSIGDKLKLRMKELEAEIQGRKEVQVKRDTLALEQPEKDRQYGETQRHNRASEENTRRGQDLTYQGTLEGAERQAQALENTINRYLTPAEAAELGVPVGTRMRDLKGTTPPPKTEAQAGAMNFGMRAKEADRQASDIEANTPEVTSLLQKGVSSIPFLGNYLTPEKLQQYETAKRQFIGAVLRKESGAAISDTEYKREEAKYFPQPGDAASVIQQKAAYRAQAIQGLETQAGRTLPTATKGDTTLTLPDGRTVTFPNKAARDAAAQELGVR